MCVGVSIYKAKLQNAALALTTRCSIILTSMEEDVKALVNKYSKPPSLITGYTFYHMP